MYCRFSINSGLKLNQYKTFLMLDPVRNLSVPNVFIIFIIYTIYLLT